MSKKEFEVAVEWSVCGTLKIKASSLEEAIKQAEDHTPSSVSDSFYIDSSWSVNEEVTRDLNLEVGYEDEGGDEGNATAN